MQFASDSTVMNLMDRDMVMKPGILLINMMLIHRAVFLNSLRIGLGTGSMLSRTRCGIFLTVLPFNDLRSGPNMCSAAVMSDLLTGLLARCLIAT